MKKIPLHNRKGTYALVDDSDHKRVSKLKWRYSPVCKSGYAVSQVGLLHNFITGLKGVDHKNRNGLDCQRGNLRKANQSQNGANRGRASNNTSGFKGVCWHKYASKWVAKIKVSEKTIYLGLFINPIQAAKAYDSAAKKYYGEFALPNFPMRFPRR